MPKQIVLPESGYKCLTLARNLLRSFETAVTGLAVGDVGCAQRQTHLIAKFIGNNAPIFAQYLL
jgi:hypothetical protein